MAQAALRYLMSFPDVDVAFARAVGARLRHLRQAGGLVLTDVGTRAGTANSRLSRIETGSGAESLTLVTLFRICQALDVVPADVVAAAYDDVVGSSSEQRKEQ